MAFWLWPGLFFEVRLPVGEPGAGQLVLRPSSAPGRLIKMGAIGSRAPKAQTQAGAGPGATPGLVHPSGLGPGRVPAEPREPPRGGGRPARPGTHVDDVPAGILVVVPDEEVDEDAPVELRVHHGQLLLQLPGGAWGGRPDAGDRQTQASGATGNHRGAASRGCAPRLAADVGLGRSTESGARARSRAGSPGSRGRGLGPP